MQFNGRNLSSRVALWVLLVLPVVLVLVVPPLLTHLDKGVTESHRAWNIWKTMSQNLPQIDAQWVVATLFWVGISVFLVGVGVLIWLALDSPSDTKSVGTAPIAEVTINVERLATNETFE